MWPSALFSLTRSCAGDGVLSWSCVGDDVSWSCVGADVLSRAVAQLRDGEGGMVDGRCTCACGSGSSGRRPLVLGL